VKGFFITFEGPEGSGKSTHSRLLARRLRAQGLRVLLTREPGGPPLSEAIRSVLLDPIHDPADKTELLLYMAARHEHVKRKIQPALQKNQIVLCDRFSDSTLAYQAFGRGLSLGFVRKLDRWVCNGVKPDLTLLLDVPVSVGLKRARARKGRSGGDRLERESRSFHEKVRRGYLTLAHREPARIKVIKLKPTVGETFQEVLKIVKRRLSF
jgi:dTMP kinase